MSAALVPVLRPERTLVWLPPQIAERLGVQRGAQLTEAQWQDRELAALIHSRDRANETGRRCDVRWHEENGYA